MKANKSLRLVVALVAVALVAAACGDDGGGGEELEPGELGAVTVASGESIQIRSIQVLSGPDATLGIPEERATRMAVEHYGDIHGFSVEVGTSLDGLCTADGGQAAAQIVVSDTQVVGVVGTSCSGEAQSAMPLISEAGMVMISGSNTSPSLTSDFEGTAGENYYEGYYRTAHNDLIQGQASANFVFNELEITQVALIHDGDPYTQGLTTAFQNAFEALGGTITAHTSAARGTTDMVPVLTEVAATSPELIFMPIFIAEGTYIVQQIGQVSGLEDVALMAADALQSPDFMGLPEAEGFYLSGPDLRFGDATAGATGVSADQFLTEYEEAYGESPTAPFWAHAYDATLILLTAIEEVAVMDGDDLFIDREALREAMTATSSFEGITGTLSCDDFGDCAAGKIAIVQNTDPADFDASLANVVYGYPEE